MTLTLPPRLRVRYTRVGRVRFISQRDTARIFERSLRRLRVPVKYSEGFSPHPILSFSAALPTGGASEAEFLDIRVDAAEVSGGFIEVGASSETDLREFAGQLSAVLPMGMEVTGIVELDGTETSLQEAVACMRWEVDVRASQPPALEVRIANLMAAAEVVVERQRKGRPVVDNIRENIAVMESEATPDGVRLTVELLTQPRGIRLTELLAALGSDVELLRATRTHQWIDQDGERREPVVAGSFTIRVPSASSHRDDAMTRSFLREREQHEQSAH
jgi:radical SAM-linked protein